MHPAIEHVLKFFSYDRLPANFQEVLRPFCELAKEVAERAPDNQETTIALRKLLEAKDAAVRAILPLLMLAVFAGAGRAQEADARARAALALALVAQAPRPPQAPELSHDDHGEPLTYAEAYHRALREDKPLLVWVGGNFCERCVHDSATEFVHYFTDTYANATVPSIVVGVPDNKGTIDRVADIRWWIEGDVVHGHIPTTRRHLAAWKATGTRLSGDARPAQVTAVSHDAFRWSTVAPPAFQPMFAGPRMRMGGGGMRCGPGG